ncbi:hypothetical protein CTAYLR_004182 [Chrysophaeum taylorii]|uniref:N-acylneuraminate cytidylyltransferase n=1 Tax=Chrysophaeum taylorii TaxID=2483200 RepID=A0AAD7UH03_9STRA|nr:hypothetical protein CTAYLR_004182 [Chrysophaeum taylorii]
MAHALILARGGSKGIPKKNIKLLNGVPLVVYNIKAALESGVFAVVAVSSDDDEILAIARAAGAATHKRSPAAATDTATSEVGIFDYLEHHHPCDVLALVQCTSPLTTADDFRNAWELFRNSGADGLVTVVRTHRFLWRVEDGGGVAAPMNYDPAYRPRRQDWAGELVENGAFYLMKVASLRASGSRLSGKIVAYEMPEDTLVEIDSLVDWTIAEVLAKARFGDSPTSWLKLPSFLPSVGSE